MTSKKKFPIKIENGSFGRKVSVLENPFIFECERPWGEFTQEDVNRFKEMMEYYLVEELDDAS